MPTKTKKEKLLAQQRRKSIPIVTNSTFLSISLVQLPTIAITREKSDMTHAEDLSLVRHDVVKTILLGLVAISIELVMYWYGLRKI